MASLNLVGAVCVGRHGSSGVDPETGRAHLASNSEYITAVQMVLADGSVREFRRGVDREFDGAVTSCRSRRYFLPPSLCSVQVASAAAVVDRRVPGRRDAADRELLAREHHGEVLGSKAVGEQLGVSGEVSAEAGL